MQACLVAGFHQFVDQGGGNHLAPLLRVEWHAAVPNALRAKVGFYFY